MPIDLPPIPQIEQKYEKTDSGLLKPKKNIFMPGMGFVLAGVTAGQRAPAELSLTDTKLGYTNSSGYEEFLNVSLGAEQYDRWIFLCVTVESNREATSATIAGSSCSLLAGPATATNPTPDTTSSIFGKFQPTGTSATIGITLSGAVADWMGLAVLRVVGGSGIISDTAVGNATDKVTLDIEARGIGIVCQAVNGSEVPVVTPYNCTELAHFAVNGDSLFAGYYYTDVGVTSYEIGSTGATSYNTSTTGIAFY